MIIVPNVLILFAVSVVFGVISCLALWSKTNFVCDAASHSTVFSIALTSVLSGYFIGQYSTIILIVFILAVLYFFFFHFRSKNKAGILPIVLMTISYSILNIGLVIAHYGASGSTHSHSEVEVFGNILFGGGQEFLISFDVISSIIIIITLFSILITKYYREMILLFISKELCQKQDHVLFLISSIVSVFVILTTKFFGIFTSISLIIFPGIVAQLLQFHSPFRSILASVLSIFIALILSSLIKTRIAFGVVTSVILLCILAFIILIKYVRKSY
jgi:ABC-type Mn2+/Zn2+ transport system permease subunit